MWSVSRSGRFNPTEMSPWYLTNGNAFVWAPKAAWTGRRSGSFWQDLNLARPCGQEPTLAVEPFWTRQTFGFLNRKCYELHASGWSLHYLKFEQVEFASSHRCHVCTYFTNDRAFRLVDGKRWSGALHRGDCRNFAKHSNDANKSTVRCSTKLSQHSICYVIPILKAIGKWP